MRTRGTRLLIFFSLYSRRSFFSYIQDENIKIFKRHGTRNKERCMGRDDNLASATGLIMSILLIMSCYSTLGSLTCEEDGNLSTRDLGFIYVSSEGRVDCEFIHPAQPTDAPSSRRSSRSNFYTPGLYMDVVEWSRALDVRLGEWCCSVSMVWVQIPSREEQKFDSSKI